MTTEPEPRDPAATARRILDRADRGKTLTPDETAALRGCLADLDTATTAARQDRALWVQAYGEEIAAANERARAAKQRAEQAESFRDAVYEALNLAPDQFPEVALHTINAKGHTIQEQRQRAEKAEAALSLWRAGAYEQGRRADAAEAAQRELSASLKGAWDTIAAVRKAVAVAREHANPLCLACFCGAEAGHLAAIAAALDSEQPAEPEVQHCCVCASTHVAYHNYAGQTFCGPCADCGCGQTPCVRTGTNDPAVSAEAAEVPCFHPSWETYTTRRRCTDCGEWLDPEPQRVQCAGCIGCGGPDCIERPEPGQGDDLTTPLVIPDTLARDLWRALGHALGEQP